jgi:putative RecB family exonuclease
LKYKLSRIDKIAEPPTQETLMGNFVHEVIENLYAFEQSERTVALAKSIATNLWASGQWEEAVRPYLKNLSLNEFRWNSWWCIENAFIIENPQSFTPDGIESELNGKIGGVQMRGFIDRWLIDGDTITISDYKTGKTPSPKYMGDKLFQLTVYSLR